jgi:hypothetical protein
MTDNHDADPVSRMTNRLTEIEGETAKYHREIKRLASEAEEIKSALSVLRRYGAVVTSPKNANADQVAPAKAEMTVPDMIKTIVHEHAIFDGATGQDILKIIRKRWDPDADPNIVRPTLWRMVKTGRLVKDEDRYMLPEDLSGPGAKAPEPSKE